MQPMSEGIDLDANVMIQTLQNKLAQGVIREAQMEAAIQQLMQEKQQLEAQLAATEDAGEAEVVEV